MRLQVEEYADEVFDLLDNGAHIYFCGLKGMMPGIQDMLERVAGEKGCVVVTPYPDPDTGLDADAQPARPNHHPLLGGTCAVQLPAFCVDTGGRSSGSGACDRSELKPVHSKLPWDCIHGGMLAYHINLFRAPPLARKCQACGLKVVG